jgi:hypothetical protein
LRNALAIPLFRKLSSPLIIEIEIEIQIEIDNVYESLIHSRIANVFSKLWQVSLCQDRSVEDGVDFDLR